MEPCNHGMDAEWCYLCRIERSGVDPHAAWGLDVTDDPTNGILTQTDHVRTAVGRNRLDATPTAGTIFVGGAGETLAVEVSVEPHG